MKITGIEDGNWVGLSYWGNYLRQIDYFSTPDSWQIGFEIVYRFSFFSRDRALDHGERLDGLKQAFKRAFGLADDHYDLDEIDHVTKATVYWRVLWDRDAFNLNLLGKCEDDLNKFAERDGINGISIVVLETTIIPRSKEFIALEISTKA